MFFRLLDSEFRFAGNGKRISEKGNSRTVKLQVGDKVEDVTIGPDGTVASDAPRKLFARFTEAGEDDSFVGNGESLADHLAVGEEITYFSRERPQKSDKPAGVLVRRVQPRGSRLK